MTRNVTLDRVSLESLDPNDDRIARLRDLFPEAFSEGKLDWAKLRATLGDAVDDRPERYSFTWAGKRDAIKLLQMPTRATLTPAQDESVQWDTTQNLFIEGDNLEVLKLLYKPYFGRVKMIYIDPPYNTGNDFIYPDNFADPLGAYLTLTGQQDEDGNLLTSNPDTSGRYHSSWLSMMYPRLFLARQLLRDDGVIFVSIDDHEVHDLRLLMNEVFGEENFVACNVWQKRYSRDNRPVIGAVHDYILLYAKDAERFASVRSLLPPDEKSQEVYRNPNNDPRGRWRPIPMTAQGKRPNQMYKITTPAGIVHEPPKGRCWSMIEEQYLKLLHQGRIWFGTDGKGQPNVIRYLSEVEGFVPWTWWPHTEVGHTDEAKKEIHHYFGKEDAFDTPKPSRLIKRILQISTKSDEQAIVLDFFAGSATTAQAVLELNHADGGNRRFVMVQLPEPISKGEGDFTTIADIGKERIRRVIAAIERAKQEQLDLTAREAPEDLGFRVFKLAPSSFRPWQGVAAAEPEVYAEQMALFDDQLVGAWQPAIVIWEVALKEGFGLNARVEPVERITTNAVYRVADPDRDQCFYICLDGELQPATVTALALDKDDLFICRDLALTDEMAANLALQCRLKAL